LSAGGGGGEEEEVTPLPNGVQRYFSPNGDEYFYCIKSGKTVWDVNDIKEGEDI
jgi:hypothetical protein